MTEPTETTQPTDVQVSPVSPASTDPRQPSLAELVPGERLGVPLGSTRVIGDYGRPRPSYVFLALVSIVTLVADVATKAWAARRLDGYPGIVEVWTNHLTLVLARNRGGAWGLLQSTSENVRRPFFLLVSVAAIAFIMTLYRRLLPRQRSLRWGLPLVLGGALGNVLDRIRYGQVIDFIDAHIVYKGIDRHWPTFNVADIAICVGVGLMAIDMFTSKRSQPLVRAPHVPPSQSGEPAAEWGDPSPSEQALEVSQPVQPPVDGGAPPPSPAQAPEAAGAPEAGRRP